MPKILDKVEINGKLSNKCPICGEGCTVSSWNKYKKCIECHRLILKGIDVARVKIIRAGEDLDKLYVGETNETVEEVIDRKNLFDFRNTFPLGMRISVRDKQEAKHLQDVYGFYSAKYGTGIPEFNVLIGGILQLELEKFRNSESLQDVNLPTGQRGAIQETLIKLINQIERTTRALSDLKQEMSSESGNVLQKAFGEMLKFHHENDQMYMGVGLCDDCKKRIIFKTNFTTFRAVYEEKLDTIVEDFKKYKKYDQLTIDTIYAKIKDTINDDALASTYVIEHTRQLEAELI